MKLLQKINQGDLLTDTYESVDSVVSVQLVPHALLQSNTICRLSGITGRTCGKMQSRRRQTWDSWKGNGLNQSLVYIGKLPSSKQIYNTLLDAEETHYFVYDL